MLFHIAYMRYVLTVYLLLRFANSLWYCLCRAQALLKSIVNNHLMWSVVRHARVVERHCLRASHVYFSHTLHVRSCPRTPPLCRFLTGRLRAGRPFIAVLRLHAACQIVSGIDRSGRQDVLSVASGVASVNRKGKHRISFLSVYRSSRN